MLSIFSKERLNERERRIELDHFEIIVLICDAIRESVVTLRYNIKDNLGKIGNFIYIVIPYVCILCERNGMLLHNNFLTFVIPLLLVYIVYIVKKADAICHNRTSDNIPLPYNRFTTEDADGMITVEEGRMEELLLYVDELENELERLGKL